ncbi:hypothetical protein GE09DRAFT_1232332 [Coniochaeta sp. 2T2.1]|nr:hypothetical protein GE09DRAFT_1232332 [Coniochaeta sp. 2T2.1]
MHATLSSLALGLVAVAGLTQATMIPNSVLGFAVPKAEAAQIASRDDATPPTGIEVKVIPNAGKFDRHTVIANIQELSAAATEAKRDESRAYVKRTMIPNAELGFTLPAAAAKRDVTAGTINVQVIPNAGKFDRHTVIANAEELSAGPETTKRDESRAYEKRTMIPNAELGFTLPAAAAKRDVTAGTINVKVIPNAGKYERHTYISNAELGFELPAAETKREEARPYEKRTMIPNSALGFELPSEAKLASRSAAWARVVKA